MRLPSHPVRRVLVFLVGSLGDTLVTLPVLRLVAAHYPDAERRLLTNFSISEKAAPISALLDGTGLIHGYIRYPAQRRDPRQLLQLAATIRRWKPDLLVYLHEPHGLRAAYRDAAFFRACGIRHMIGVPYRASDQFLMLDSDSGRSEHRSEYLARLLAQLGNARLEDRSSWNLLLSGSEQDTARSALAPLLGCTGILSASIGSKVDVKDWGDDNWRRLLRSLSERLPGWGLVMIGAPSEHERTANLLTAWRGRSLNLCGGITLRQCAAVLEHSDVYLGHDSGPMHLAATVGTPCVAIFSARNPPGEWFPYGEGHTVFYKKTECYGCRLDTCTEFAKKCILSISVDEVAEAVVNKALAVTATGRACELAPE
ncbi:MAG: glycosyltransferase family 9 protein [Nevskia sp.]|nr:glycosyltransferase family 9 protein [Nevskia sp.]